MAIIALQSKQTKELECIQASYATVKFCKFFAMKKPCRIKGCRFLHFLPPKSEIIFDIEDLKKSYGRNMALFDLQLKFAYEFA